MLDILYFAAVNFTLFHEQNAWKTFIIVYSYYTLTPVQNKTVNSANIAYLV